MVRILIVLAFIFPALIASAEQQVQVYRAEALVASQSAAERNKAARASLAEVVVRVSGDSAALEHPGIREALTRAHTYIYEYSYASTDEHIEIDNRQVPATRLLLKFSPQAVEQLLRETQLSLWPANRPTLLVWSARRDQDGIIHRIPEEDVRAALYQQAGVRGVPLLLPVQDLEDNLALSVDDLWSGEEELIKAASERYRPDAILIGRYSQLEEGWSAHWQLLHTSDIRTFETQAADAPSLFVQALNASADYFAHLYAIAPGEDDPGSVVMRIENVRDFASYKNLERYLQGLAVVNRVELMLTESQRLLVRLHLAGDLTLLLSTLELGKKLFPDRSQSVAVIAVAPHPSTPVDNGQTAEPALTGEAYEADTDAPVTFAPARGTEANPLIYRWQP